MSVETAAELPPGWITTTVGAVCQILGGGTPSTKNSAFWEGDIPWITSADIQGIRDIQPRRHITKEAIQGSATNLVPAGAVVVATRVGLGKVGWIDEPLCFSQDCQGLVFSQSCVGPLYLAYYLGQAVQGFKHVSRGTTISGVPKNELRDLLLLLPPLSEQHRIVTEIEKHLTRLNAAVEALKRAQATLQRYRASVLKTACEGRLVPTEAALARAEGREYEHASAVVARVLKERETSPNPLRSRRGLRSPLSAGGEGPGMRYTEPQPPGTFSLPPLPEGWVWGRVEHLCEVGTGSTPLTSKREYYDGGTTPWVTSAAVNSLQVSTPEKWITEAAIRDHRLRRYPAGALILAMYGEGHNRGKVAELLFDATINQALAALVFQDEGGNCKDYTKWFLVSRYEETRRASSGGVQPNLNLGLVGRIPIPLPPLAEQQRIVAEVERRLSVTQAAEKVVGANLKRAERLRQAILKRAFEGKLVPQDPSDEPASVLLERIRAERNTSPNPLRKRRGLPSARSSVTSSPLRTRRGAGGEVAP